MFSYSITKNHIKKFPKILTKCEIYDIIDVVINMENEIIGFTGKHFFLSNFYERDVTYEGVTYKNNEAAFQAQKLINEKEKQRFSNLSPSEAKKLGRSIELRKDWETIKSSAMYYICMAKFSQNEDLKKRLIETADLHLEETNWWHDNCWGNCTCNKCKDIQGENRLGRILMLIRDELKGK